MSDEWTVDKLDEVRARMVASARPFNDQDWRTRLGEAIRRVDEAAGLSTQALLDVLNGKAVIVPIEPTREMHDAARDWAVKKYGQGIGTDGSDGCYKAMVEATPYKATN